MKGEGNQQDYGMRVYDNRLGKFLSVDPLTKEYPWTSTYAFAENDVIKNVDLDGMEPYIATDGSYIGISLSNKNPDEIRIATSFTVKNGITLINSYKVVKYNDSKNELKKLYADAASDNKERTGYIVLDAYNGEVSFKQLNATGQNYSALDPYAAGDEYLGQHNQVVLANVHTHQDEHNFIGKTAVGGGKSRINIRLITSIHYLAEMVIQLLLEEADIQSPCIMLITLVRKKRLAVRITYLVGKI
ncbi:hypothetical protein K1Y79_21765 [Chitinophaga sp. B61]|uniref:RHS repeat-associated core domain-containing protein n=1 Tax=Chitinophaga rhizophila TaxID=2866212 RepID=A0ABS7GH01_9BACT|nr:hypothetical protein [Chitinophaga rhizophila]